MKVCRVVLCAVWVILIAPSGWAQLSGQIDLGFNAQGGANNSVNALAIQPDCRVLVAGQFNQFAGQSVGRIIRLNLDGSIDAGFNPGSGTNNAINALVAQTDGKIILAGQFNQFDGQSVGRIARLNSTGSLDATFNTSGTNGIVNTLALQPDGKIIVAGQFNQFDGQSVGRIIRLNTDGTKDATFNTGGGANGHINTVAVQADGKILVAGQFNQFDGQSVGRITRLHANGSLDATFNTSGGASGHINTVAVQADGKILVGGQFIQFGGQTVNRITRLNADGSIDMSFLSGTGTIGNVHIIAIDKQQKILVGGQMTSYNDTPVNRLFRLKTDGKLDDEFMVGDGPSGTVNAIAHIHNSKLMVGGDFLNFDGVSTGRIARLHYPGMLDHIAGVTASGSQDGTGSNASFYGLQAICFNPLQNKFFLADGFNHSIRMLSLGGDVTTLCGSTEVGTTDGILEDASFHTPAGLAYDAINNLLYVADKQANNIRKIDLDNGQVTTLAGGQAGYEEGIGSQARFNAPIGLALLGTTLYVADHGNHAIRTVDVQTGTVSTLAGNGTPGYVNGTGAGARFRKPWNVVTDGTQLYVTDYGNHAIRQLTLSGTVTTTTGNGSPGHVDGAAANARLKYPTGMAFLHGKLYFTDHGNHALRELCMGAVITHLGNHVLQPTRMGLLSPVGMASDGVSLYIVDAFAHQVSKLAP